MSPISTITCWCRLVGTAWPGVRSRSRRHIASNGTWPRSVSCARRSSPAAAITSRRSSRSRVELVDLDRAYVRNGSVYFRGAEVAVSSGLSRERATELAREHGGHPDDPDKDDPLDAALWQRSVGDEPAWPSPWGPGRPGWHAECTAMALSTFGPTVDLHVGGADLAFPHHAYEAAQAEAYTGVRPFARAWLHVGSVLVDGEKMAKSTGNLVYVHDVLDRYPPGALRLLILSRQWAEPWEFTEGDLDRAAGELEQLWRHGSSSGDRDIAEHEVAMALLDNLDVRPRARHRQDGRRASVARPRRPSRPVVAAITRQLGFAMSTTEHSGRDLRATRRWGDLMPGRSVACV